MDLILHLQSLYSLPYPPGNSGGLHAILLGAYPLLDNDPKLQNQIEAEFDCAKARCLPRFTVDPLGFAISACAVSSRRNLLDDLARATGQGPRHRLLAEAAWNVFHLALATPSLEMLGATCKENGVDGLTDFRDDSALVYRLKQQAVHLFIPPSSSGPVLHMSEAELRNEALRQMQLKHAGFKLIKSWRNPNIFRRTRQPRPQSDDVTVRMKLNRSHAVRMQLRKSAIADELHDLKSIRDAASKDREQDRSLCTRQSATRFGHLSFSDVPPPGGVSQSELAILRAWTQSNLRGSTEALLLALQDTAHLSDDDLSSARIERHGRCAYLVTRCPLLTDDVDTCPKLHFSVTDEFWRPIPPLLAEPASILFLNRDIEKLCLDRDVLLRDRFRISFSKLSRAWLYNAPVWDNCPWLLAEFGLNGVRADELGRLKMPGYRSYLLWNLAVHEERIIRSLAERGWEIEVDPAVNEIPRCGSRHCPKPEVVDQMIDVLAALISSAMINMPDDEIGMACLLNAIASLTRLIEVMLTFARNYPGEAPRVISCSGTPRLLEPLIMRHEKIRDRPLAYGRELSQLLNVVAEIFRRAFSTLRARHFRFVRDGNPVESEHFCYSFYPHRPFRKLIALQHPRKSLIVDGLLHHPATEGFADISMNAMRNYGYYRLTSSSPLDFSVMDLCDHIPNGGRGRLARGCAASITNTRIREEAARKLINPESWPWR